MKFPQACLIVFAKEPIAGQVKTRLIPALGAEGAKDLHQQLMDNIFAVTNSLSLCHTQLWVNQNPQSAAFDGFKGSKKVQDNVDLGLRMHGAIFSELKEYSQVIIIGSDCPPMDEAYIAQALEALVNDQFDVVLGPAEDGGYVLIGMNSPHPEVFEGIEWGTSRVLAQTRTQLENNHLLWKELPTLFDIDRPEDLEKLSTVLRL